jgi:cyclophilin family peptidyl-prolyl cis-trans isomerase
MLDTSTPKYYDETFFHRVIDGFLIQGGGFTRDLMQKKTNAPIKKRGRQRASERTRHVAIGGARWS